MPIYKKTIQEYLINGGPRCASDWLKKRLFEAGLKERRCDSCKLETWLGKPIALDMHHVDGDNLNNLWENLQVLCPNCHAQTPNYRAGGRGNVRDMGYTAARNGWPPKEVLANWVRHVPLFVIAKHHGVTKGTVAYWVKRYGMEAPGRSYWCKTRPRPDLCDPPLPTFLGKTLPAKDPLGLNKPDHCTGSADYSAFTD